MNKINISDASKDDFKDIAKHKKEFDISIPDKNTHTLVARTPLGELIGFVELSYSKSKFIEVKRIAVRGKYKRIGVGRKLMGIVRAIAIKRNQKILLNSSTYTDAQNFWKIRQGFKSTGEKGRFDLLEELALKPKSVKRVRKRK